MGDVQLGAYAEGYQQGKADAVDEQRSLSGDMAEIETVPDSVVYEAWSEFRYPRPATDEPTPSFRRAVQAAWAAGRRHTANQGRKAGA